MKMNINLAQSSEKCPCCPTSIGEPEPYYPSFRVEKEGESLDIPDEGTMTITFKKVEETESKRGNTERYVCCIEVREIVSVSGSEKPSKSGAKETEEALDSLMREKAKEKEYEEED